MQKNEWKMQAQQKNSFILVILNQTFLSQT